MAYPTPIEQVAIHNYRYELQPKVIYLENLKTIFNYGIPKYTKIQTLWPTKLASGGGIPSKTHEYPIPVALGSIGTIGITPPKTVPTLSILAHTPIPMSTPPLGTVSPVRTMSIPSLGIIAPPPQMPTPLLGTTVMPVQLMQIGSLGTTVKSSSRIPMSSRITPTLGITITSAQLMQIGALGTTVKSSSRIPMSSRITPTLGTITPSSTQTMQIPALGVVAPAANMPTPELKITAPPGGMPTPELGIAAPPIPMPIPTLKAVSPTREMQIPNGGVTAKAKVASQPTERGGLTTPKKISDESRLSGTKLNVTAIGKTARTMLSTMSSPLGTLATTATHGTSPTPELKVQAAPRQFMEATLGKPSPVATPVERPLGAVESKAVPFVEGKLGTVTPPKKIFGEQQLGVPSKVRTDFTEPSLGVPSKPRVDFAEKDLKQTQPSRMPPPAREFTGEYKPRDLSKMTSKLGSITPRHGGEKIDRGDLPRPTKPAVIDLSGKDSIFDRGKRGHSFKTDKPEISNLGKIIQVDVTNLLKMDSVYDRGSGELGTSFKADKSEISINLGKTTLIAPFDLTTYVKLPVPKTFQETIAEANNKYIDLLNKYPYIERRNDVLTADARSRAEKYPPEILIHTTGGEGYPGKGFDDKFIRGGIVLSTARAVEDVIRVGNFLLSGNGVLWMLREQGLQMTNARPETRIFNPLTVTLQTGVGHLGMHLPRHGLNPFSEGVTGTALEFGWNSYSSVKDYEGEERGGKRFSALSMIATPRKDPKLIQLAYEMFQGKEVLNLTPSSLFYAAGNEILSAFGLEPKKISEYAPPRDKAAGGPGIGTLGYLEAVQSTYGGLTGTGMHRAVNTLRDEAGTETYKYPRDKSEADSELVSMVKDISSPLGGVIIGGVTGLVGGGLMKGATGAIGGAILGGIAGGVISSIGAGKEGTTSMPASNPDLLKTYKSLAYGELGVEKFKYMTSEKDTLEGPTENYKLFPKVSGRRRASLREHALINRGFADPGNILGTATNSTTTAYKGGLSMKSPAESGEIKDNKYDLIPFIFYDIKNDHSLVFRATLKDISDNITPDWGEYNYVGNPQTYHIYKRTTRELSFTFTIYTETENELRWNWLKLNRFVGMAYPSFTSAQRMVGPFLRLTIGDMFNRVPGFLTNITVTVDVNTPWEINLFPEDDAHLAKLPHVVDCAVTYKIIGDKPLEGTTTPFYMQTKMKDIEWTGTQFVMAGVEAVP